MKRRGLDGRFPRKPEPIENPIRGFARAAFSFWTGRQVSILFATFFFCSVVLFPGAYIGLMGLSMRRSPAWEPDEQGTDSIKRVFRLSGKNRFPGCSGLSSGFCRAGGRRGIWPFPERQNNLPVFSPCRSLGCFPSIPVSFYR